MKFRMKQEFWSFGDSFTIQDDAGNDRYQVDGKVFSFGDKLHMLDMEGNEVAYIEQRLLSWGPVYEISLPDGTTTVVSKKLFTLFRCKFTIDGPGNADYNAEGDFMDHEYEITGRNGLAATVTKRWFSFRDTYGIEIASGENPVLLLAVAVVIDMVCHDGEDG